MNEDRLAGAIRGINEPSGRLIGHADPTSAGQCSTNICSEAVRTIRSVVEVPAVDSFPEALAACISGGHRITRAGWNAGGQHVEAQRPDKGSRMSVPYLVLKNAQNELVPWVPSQGDLFARDWAILPR